MSSGIDAGAYRPPLFFPAESRISIPGNEGESKSSLDSPNVLSYSPLLLHYLRRYECNGFGVVFGCGAAIDS